MNCNRIRNPKVFEVVFVSDLDLNPIVIWLIYFQFFQVEQHHFRQYWNYIVRYPRSPETRTYLWALFRPIKLLEMSRNKNFFFVIIWRALFDVFENIFETRIFLGYISYDLGRVNLQLSGLGFKRRTQQRHNFSSGLKWRLMRLGGELPIHLTTINKLNLGFLTQFPSKTNRLVFLTSN